MSFLSPGQLFTTTDRFGFRLSFELRWSPMHPPNLRLNCWSTQQHRLSQWSVASRWIETSWLFEKNTLLHRVELVDWLIDWLIELIHPYKVIHLVPITMNLDVSLCSSESPLGRTWPISDVGYASHICVYMCTQRYTDREATAKFG